MKRKIGAILMLLMVLFLTSCVTKEKTPKINLSHQEITLKIGDKLDLKAGVTATGLKGEDVLDLLKIEHHIPVDDEGRVTTAGEYTVNYQLEIEEKVYQNSLKVVVEEEVIIDELKFINGNFDGTEPLAFTKSDFEGAESTLAVTKKDGTNMLCLDIKAVSWGTSAPRVEYQNMTLEEGKIYKIAFKAYAETPRAMRIQIGELLEADPYFKSAMESVFFFDLTNTLETYSFTFSPEGSISGADLTNLSFLLEFGKFDYRASEKTKIYFDDFTITTVDTLELDTTKPHLLFTEKDDSFFINEYFTNITSRYVAYTDERGETLEIKIDEEKSTMPPVNEDGRLTEAGTYKVVFYAVDKALNRGELVWDFVVEDAYPVTNGFNIIDFLSGDASMITEGVTQYGYVYAENSDTTFDYQDGVLTIKTTQSKTDNNWTATQIFARTVRQEGLDGANKFTLSFDITSNVEGYIQVNELPFKIIKGTTTIAIEGNIFNYNYKNLVIVLGVHRSLMSVEQNIGPCEVAISNLSFVNTHEVSEDVIAPVLKLNGNKTYFVGDEFNLLQTIQLIDFRSKADSKVEVDEAHSDVIPMSAGVLTEAGTYHVTFIATDGAGNKSSYEFSYVVKPTLENFNGFNVQEITFGEEGTLDDPSIVYLWHDGPVIVTSQVSDSNNFAFTTDQKTDSQPWYATQLFFKSLKVDKWGLYELSFDIVSNINGKITICNSPFEMNEGTTTYSQKIAIPAGNFQKITMQLGQANYGNIGPCSIEIKNLSLTLVDLPEGNYWEGYEMSVVNNETESIIDYQNTPNEWYTHNARTYIFNTTATFQALVIEFMGTIDHSYQFKFEGLNQAIFEATSVVATGERQRVIIDARNRTEAQRLTMYNLLVFVQTVGASGQITIYGYEFFENFNDVFTTDWFSFGGMSITDGDNGSTITYDNIPTNWWEANAQHLMDGEFSEDTISISFTFTGIEGHIYLFKVEGNGYAYEQEIVGTGSEQVFTISLASLGTNVAKLKLAVVFCKTSGANGTITIHQTVVNKKQA